MSQLCACWTQDSSLWCIQCVIGDWRALGLPYLNPLFCYSVETSSSLPNDLGVFIYSVTLCKSDSLRELQTEQPKGVHALGLAEPTILCTACFVSCFLQLLSAAGIAPKIFYALPSLSLLYIWADIHYSSSLDKLQDVSKCSTCTDKNRKTICTKTERLKERDEKNSVVTSVMVCTSVNQSTNCQST